MRKLSLFISLAGLLVLTAPLSPTFGQAFTGTITGTITDPNAAAIPGTAVQIKNEATGDLRHAVSGADGLYIFSQIPPGTYQISAEIAGFRKSVQPNVVLRVNQTLESNIALQVGDVSQTVEVTASVSLLDTQSANRAVTLDQQTVLDLPTNARNPFQFVHVNAGVIAVRTGISQATQDRVLKRFRDLCLAPCCRPLWGAAPCGRYAPVVPRRDGHGPAVVSETGRRLTVTGPVR